MTHEMQMDMMYHLVMIRSAIHMQLTARELMLIYEFPGDIEQSFDDRTFFTRVCEMERGNFTFGYDQEVSLHLRFDIFEY